MTGTRTLDVQAHLLPEPYVAALRSVSNGSGRAAEIAAAALADPRTMGDPIFTGAIDERLALMDAGGVDTQLLSFPAPNVWADEVQPRREVTAAFNDGCAEVVAAHPGRFGFLASLPVPHVEAAVDEARRALDTLGAVGVSLCTNLDGRTIDDEHFTALLAELDARRATVLLHPEGFSVPDVLSDYGMEWAIGTPFDDTIVALRLIYGGVLDRHPHVRWIVPHLGGTLPLLARRLDFIWQHAPPLQELSAEMPSVRLRELLFDTANPDPRSVALAGDVLGWDRLLFASDFPFAARHDPGRGLQDLAAAGVPAGEHAAVAGERAAELLGMGA